MSVGTHDPPAPYPERGVAELIGRGTCPFTVGPTRESSQLPATELPIPQKHPSRLAVLFVLVGPPLLLFLAYAPFEQAVGGNPARFQAAVLPWLFPVVEGIFVLIALRLIHRDGQSWEQLAGFGKVPWRHELPWALLIFLVMAGIIATYALIVTLAAPSAATSVIYSGFPWWYEAGMVITVPVFAGFCEETIYRAYAVTRLRALGFSPRSTMILSALAFMTLHVDPVDFPYTFVIGLFLAWLYQKRGRLLPMILAHIAIDVIGYLGVFFVLPSILQYI